MLAAHAAIRHFCHFCEVRTFQLWTDHKLLVIALSCVSAPILPQQQRHLAFISEFNVHMLYLPGLKNVVADFRPTHPPPHRRHLELLLRRQRKIQLTSKPWPPSKTKLLRRNAGLAQRFIPQTCLQTSRCSVPGWRCFFSTGVFRPIVPEKFKKTIFAFSQCFPPWEAGLLAPCVF